MSNQDTQNEKEIEARIHEILIAFAKDFQEFIRNKPRAGKDAYKIVDMHDPNGLDASTVRVVSLSDEKAEELALACVNMANAMLWLYYRECRNTPCFSYGDIRHNVIELLLKW